MGIERGLARGNRDLNGQPKDTNRNTYAILRMGGLPEVDVEFIPN